MPNPNEIQAVNLLRRLRADPSHPEAKKAAKALIEKIQGVALTLTVPGVLQAAIARHPDAGAPDAIERMNAEVDRAQQADAELQRIFAAAIALEEQRLAPYDAACAKRGEEIQELLIEAQRAYRSKIMNQDLVERRYKSFIDKGLTANEIKELGIPAPIHGRDFVAERNAWGFELEQTTQPLIAERDVILRFKNSRNEQALPPSVLAMLEGGKS